ncbi:putative NADPH-quinone reductase [Paenibacillus sp. DS2015]|uniref:NAD(P)H-dependent oxidoreductase n=1 Tax=Paenibacillus sp. DS2015 TaxID=3373917 RepID=UPI003D1F398F
MKSNIAIIVGHPHSESYCSALATAYIQGATESGATVRVIDLSTIQFDPNLRYGYHHRTDLEEDLLVAQEAIRWADHLVFVYPTWWGTMPAILKGFIDRIFLPGFAFKYRQNSLLWDKLLKGKSAHLIVTMDTPSWYNLLVYRQAGHRIMKHATLKFCGVNPVRVTEITPVKSLSEEQRKTWLDKIHKLGARFA